MALQMGSIGSAFLMNLPVGCFLSPDHYTTVILVFDVLALIFFQDSQASFDVNGNDMDPMPRYDASNENK